MNTIGTAFLERLLIGAKRFAAGLHKLFSEKRADTACFSRIRFPLILFVLGVVPPKSAAVAIIESPSFAKADQAPLSGILSLTTDQPSRVSVGVDDGFTTWERDFYRWETAHSIPLHGFKPDRTNVITVTIHGSDGETVTASQELEFITDPLPEPFPILTLLESQPGKMEPGHTLMRLDVQSNKYRYAVIVDEQGEVVWYNETPSTADLRQLENGNLFMPTKSNLLEMNLLGEVVNTWTPPADLTIDPHDAYMTDHGTILYLAYATNLVADYPTSVTSPTVPTEEAKVWYQKMVELSADDAEVLEIWDPFYELDPRRISYLIARISHGWDAHHSNAIIEDPKDGNIVVSMRHQHAVVKFDRETGGVIWILGPHDNWGPEWQPYLLTPVGEPFEWQYGQHAPVPTAEGTWVVYDNGNDRALPFNSRLAAADNYTRAVEYKIDEEKMEVSQIWEYGKDNAEVRLYTPFKGNAEPLPQTGNVLIGFSAVTYVDGVRAVPQRSGATMIRVKEVTRETPSEVVFDLAMSVHDKPGSTNTSCTIYRAFRIPDLYGPPTDPAAHLALDRTAGGVELQILGNPEASYAIEASDDLTEWEVLGRPRQENETSGLFEFEDAMGEEDDARYYRVVTE